MADVLKRASGSLERLDTLARSAEQGLTEVNAIAGSIRRGEGSLGKLVRDEEIYRDLVALSRRGERALTALEENLDALKQTWPLSRYFDRRAYLDRERVLFQPGSQRNSRSLRTDEIFEPGRSVLTPIGRARLDEVARWCKLASRPGTQVVIAAFTDDDRDEDLAEVLTQEQADAVRNYLVDQALDPVGRLVQAAQGRLGRIRQPLAPDARRPPAQPARRRVEVILFTPQA